MGGRRHSLLPTILCVMIAASLPLSVRGGSSYSADNEVMRKLEDIMEVVTASDIAEAVAAAAKKAKVSKEGLIDIIYEGSQWGSIRTLDDLKEQLINKRVKAVTDEKGFGLGDVLNYIFTRKVNDVNSDKYIRIYSKSIETAQQFRDGDVLLLDKVTLSRLVHMDDFQDHIRNELAHQWRNNAGLKLAIPYGWREGITMFNQLYYNTIIQSLAEQYAQALRECPKSHYYVSSCHLEYVYERREKEILTAMFPDLDFKTQVIYLYARDKIPGEGAVTAADIARQLRPIMPRIKSLNHAVEPAEGCNLSSERGEGTKALLDFILSNSDIVSMNRMISDARRMRNKMKEAGYDDPYICIAESGKSASMVVHMLVQTSSVSSKRVMFCNFGSKQAAAMWLLQATGGDLEKKKRFEKHGVFIVDDLALSGTQLSDYVKHIAPFLHNVFAAPVYYTPVAKQRFLDMEQSFFGGKKISRPKARPWMMDVGYRGGIHMVVLPYMAPDNNNYYWRNYIAPLFTFHGTGVKWTDKEPIKPECGQWSDRRKEQIIACLQGTFSDGCARSEEARAKYFT